MPTLEPNDREVLATAMQEINKLRSDLCQEQALRGQILSELRSVKEEHAIVLSKQSYSDSERREIAKGVWVITGLLGMVITALALGYRFDGQRHQYVGIPDSWIAVAVAVGGSPAAYGLIKEFIKERRG